MPWKTDENGGLVVTDGNPVWIYEDGNEKGKEAPVDFKKTLTTIGNITKESMDRKGKIKDMTERYAVIDELKVDDLGEWLGQARTALDTVANLSDKEILDAGGVEKIKASITEGFEKKIANLKDAHAKELGVKDALLTEKDGNIRNLVIRGAFDQSDFLRDKTVLLPDMAYTYFGDRFGVEVVDGQLKGYAKDTTGDKLMSLSNPGEYATPLEAIELLIMEHPQKDRMLKMDASGNGSTPTGTPTKGGDLMARYNEAKAKGDGMAMISIKTQMTAAGIKPPM